MRGGATRRRGGGPRFAPEEASPRASRPGGALRVPFLRPFFAVLARIVALPILPAAGLLAALFAASGIRSAVVRRNFELTGLAVPRFYRFRLGFHLVRDLLTLAGPGPLPPVRLRARSRPLVAALRDGPALLLTAHFGNWEAQAAAWRDQGVPLLGAARPLKNPAAHRLLSRVRARRGVRVVEAGVPRAALRHLDRGGWFGLLWDQHAPDAARSGRFFGVPVALDPLPEFLAARRPVPVLFGVLLPDGTLRPVLLSKRFDPERADRLARRYHRVLELLVRRHPARWYGALHARFKRVGAYPGHRGGNGKPER